MRKTVLLICVMIMVFAGCGGKSEKTVVPADAAKSLMETVTFRDTLIEAKGDIVKDWYDLDDNVSEYSIYISGSGATAEEVAVIKTADAKTAKATVEKRIDDLKFNFENYVPAEMTKLSDPVVVTRGDVVFLVLCDDSTQAQKAIDDLFK